LADVPADVVERNFNIFKQWRALATRYDIRTHLKGMCQRSMKMSFVDESATVSRERDSSDEGK